MTTFSTENFPYPLIVLEQTDSTNRYLAELCTESSVPMEELTTVCAEYQTAGKGQRGNSWEAARGENLLFSFVLYPTFMEAQRQFVLSQLISLGIKEVLDERVKGICIKWPNDIYWQEKKICGILIENDLQGHYLNQCITGIGLNVNQTCFVSNAPNPVSLKQITGQNYDRYELLADILARIHAGYTRLQSEDAEAFCRDMALRYRQSLFRCEEWHCYEDVHGLFHARIVDVESDGRLVLEDKEGRLRSYLFKEVQYVLNE